jgi:capsular polysaccharide biosynthesis protein
MDQALWLRSVWRYRLFASLIFLLAVAATFAYLLTTPKNYQSVSLIAGSSFSEGATADVDRVLPTLAQLATSDDVSTVARQRVPGPLPGQIAANPVQNTLLLQVAVTGPDPARVAQYCNAVSQQLINRNPLPKFVQLALVQPALPRPNSASPSAKVVLPLGVLVGLALAAVGAVARDRLGQYRASSAPPAQRVRRPATATAPAAAPGRPGEGETQPPAPGMPVRRQASEHLETTGRSGE